MLLSSILKKIENKNTLYWLDDNVTTESVTKHFVKNTNMQKK